MGSGRQAAQKMPRDSKNPGNKCASETPSLPQAQATTNHSDKPAPTTTENGVFHPILPETDIVPPFPQIAIPVGAPFPSDSVIYTTMCPVTLNPHFAWMTKEGKIKIETFDKFGETKWKDPTCSKCLTQVQKAVRTLGFKEPFVGKEVPNLDSLPLRITLINPILPPFASFRESQIIFINYKSGQTFYTVFDSNGHLTVIKYNHGTKRWGGAVAAEQLDVMRRQMTSRGIKDIVTLVKIVVVRVHEIPEERAKHQFSLGLSRNAKQLAKVTGVSCEKLEGDEGSEASKKFKEEFCNSYPHLALGYTETKGFERFYRLFANASKNGTVALHGVMKEMTITISTGEGDDKDDSDCEETGSSKIPNNFENMQKILKHIRKTGRGPANGVIELIKPEDYSKYTGNEDQQEKPKDPQIKIIDSTPPFPTLEDLMDAFDRACSDLTRLYRLWKECPEKFERMEELKDAFEKKLVYYSIFWTEAVGYLRDLEAAVFTADELKESEKVFISRLGADDLPKCCFASNGYKRSLRVFHVMNQDFERMARNVIRMGPEPSRDPFYENEVKAEYITRVTQNSMRMETEDADSVDDSPQKTFPEDSAPPLLLESSEVSSNASSRKIIKARRSIDPKNKKTLKVSAESLVHQLSELNVGTCPIRSGTAIKRKITEEPAEKKEAKRARLQMSFNDAMKVVLVTIVFAFGFLLGSL